MRLPLVFRLKAPPSTAAPTRLVTTILVLVLVVLGLLAVHHAQTAQGEFSHTVLAEFDPARQSFAASSGAHPDIAGEDIAVGLVMGCIALIASCALGLALMAARAWRANLFGWLSDVTLPLRVVFIGAGSTAPATVARPSLVALGISRT